MMTCREPSTGGGGHRPALHLVIALEEPVEARVYAFSLGDEFRLIDDLEARRELRREVMDALGDALEAMRERQARAVPGDLAA